MEFIAKSFDEMTLVQLYEILRARSQIFMLEQDILCQDMDRVDYDSYHLFLENDGEVVAYLRAFYPENEPNTVCIGRVLSLQHRQGLGTKLMRQSLDFIKQNMTCSLVRLHSQQHAMGFYEKFGFVPTSEPFLEEGIPHVEMALNFD